MPSLNDTLEVGLNLLPETVGCLLRFRIHEFAITSDGKQAFSIIYSSTTFGLACSSFLLCAATRELASKHLKDFPTAALMLDKNLYTDNFVAGVETEPQIITLHRKITDLKLLFKIPMHEWATNSLMLQNLLRTQGEKFETIAKILGIEWNTKLDTFRNAFSISLCAIQDKPLTKGGLLHCVHC
ncbi:integrase catalytic domain-containing protein [Trichonephila inaurata madagascariensis]|uniref:Integrase catalytic domain-containing protein n=1 Tax=Trichonephila inaurata madagascariensis TaxID=2747483 RepID=A0A8X7C1Y1_9ARAC|nr:integrase catalytic domain-containing protein [Trichonephila inaurata madagascariensis]